MIESSKRLDRLPNDPGSLPSRERFSSRNRSNLVKVVIAAGIDPTNKLELTSSSRRDEARAIESGIEPPRRLDVKSTSSSEDKENKEPGIVPRILLSERFAICRLVAASISSGIVPSNVLTCIWNVFRAVASCIDAGIEPVSLLLFKNRLSSKGRKNRASGIVPVTVFRSSDSSESFLMDKTSSGIYEVEET